MINKAEDILFSDFFQVNKSLLAKYGAFNISLIIDLPLFIDPFLLFNSKNKAYQLLHKGIIHYLSFLRDKSIAHKIDKGLLKSWYYFGEVKQNWFGFSAYNNGGRGLGGKFATALNNNLDSIFNNFGKENITSGSHLEKLCLIKSGIGRDMISDFTANLIKGFLLEYTQEFAKKHIKKELCKEFSVDRVRFNYTTESWETDSFYLPALNGDYVILTPRNILTKDESWINRSDLIKDFESIPQAIPNESLRSLVNNYFLNALPKDPKKADREEAVEKTLEKFPELIDYFIKRQEDNGALAESQSIDKVEYSEALFLNQFIEIITLLREKTAFYNTLGDSYKEAKARANYLKQVIEDNDGYRRFYIDGEPAVKEEELKILYRLTWYGSPFLYDTEVNNGRGPADGKVSMGAKDTTMIELKLASNSQLKRNLQNQQEIHKKANQTDKGIHIIIYFSKQEKERVEKILNEIKVDSLDNYVLIDARADNKPSASKA